MIEALVPDLYVGADYYFELAAEMDLLDELEPTYGVDERPARADGRGSSGDDGSRAPIRGSGAGLDSSSHPSASLRGRTFFPLSGALHVPFQGDVKAGGRSRACERVSSRARPPYVSVSLS